MKPVRTAVRFPPVMFSWRADAKRMEGLGLTRFWSFAKWVLEGGGRKKGIEGVCEGENTQVDVNSKQG